MKYLIIASVTGLLISCAGSDKIPQAARNAFAKEFPNATHIDWDKEDDGSLEVNFEQGGKHNSATFFADGKIKESEVEISESALPTPIRQYIQTNYPKTPIKSAAVIKDSAGKVTYEVEVNSKELFFDANGKLLPQTVTEERESN